MQTSKPLSKVVSDYSKFASLKHAWIYPRSISTTISQVDDQKGDVNVTGFGVLTEGDINGYNPRNAACVIASGTLVVPGTKDYLLVTLGKRAAVNEFNEIGDAVTGANGSGIMDPADGGGGVTLDASNYHLGADLSLGTNFEGLIAMEAKTSVNESTVYAVPFDTGILVSAAGVVGAGSIAGSHTFKAYVQPQIGANSRLKAKFLFVFADGIPGDIETGLKYMAANPLALPPTWEVLP